MLLGLACRINRGVEGRGYSADVMVGIGEGVEFGGCLIYSLVLWVGFYHHVCIVE